MEITNDLQMHDVIIVCYGTYCTVHCIIVFLSNTTGLYWQTSAVRRNIAKGMCVTCNTRIVY